MTADRERRVAEAIRATLTTWADTLSEEADALRRGEVPTGAAQSLSIAAQTQASADAIRRTISDAARAAIAAMQEPEREDRSDG